VVSGFNFHYGNLSNLSNAPDLKNADAKVVIFFSVGMKAKFICREIKDIRISTPTVPGKSCAPSKFAKTFLNDCLYLWSKDFIDE